MKYKRPKRLSYAETIRFYGHDGPYLALGYKLGQVIVRRLKPKGIMDLTVTVRTLLRKPYTCLIDGLQCSTFATLGKGNLRIKDSRQGFISVIVTRGTKKLKIRVNSEAKKICQTDGDLRHATRLIFKTPDRLLFTINKS
jgi:formylmethanofuran dehydrogenase subunit E